MTCDVPLRLCVSARRGKFDSLSWTVTDTDARRLWWTGKSSTTGSAVSCSSEVSRVTVWTVRRPQQEILKLLLVRN